jgi:hypothetical protein
MIKNYLKPHLVQKLRIPINTLDEHRLGRFSSDINKILNSLEHEGNVSVVK